MEFGKHLGKGIWGLADKALPVVYGVAYVVLVIRVLPEEEFGNFVLIQELFLVISGLATGFALNPLLKFAAEEQADQANVITAGLVLNIAFILVSSLLVVLLRTPLSELLNSPQLPPLILYIPAMLAASFIRNFALVLLQARFMVKHVFWTDAIHFLGVPVLIWAYSRMHLFDSALDLILINVVTLSASSILGLWLCRSMIYITVRPNREKMQKFWDYGKYSLGGIISYLVYSKADTFILSAFKGPVQVAVYNSVKVFVRVYDMVVQVVQMFILPAASKFSARGEFATLKTIVEKAILFATVGMAPVLVVFLFVASPLVNIVYSGRYTEAIPMLQIFSVLSLFIPLFAVASNTLMGMGHAKVNFVLSVQILVASVVIYMACIPLLGATGATIGYVLCSIILAFLTKFQLDTFVPVTVVDVLRHTSDIEAFVRSTLKRR